VTGSATRMLTRRDLLTPAGRLGAGAVAALTTARPGFARDEQFGGVTQTAPKADARFPLPPTWETELKQVAPNVFAYIQAGGPGRDNASVANAGIVVAGRWRARHRHADRAAAREGRDSAARGRGRPRHDGHASASRSRRSSQPIRTASHIWTADRSITARIYITKPRISRIARNDRDVGQFAQPPADFLPVR